MIKISSLLLISLNILWSSLIVPINCDEYKVIYINQERPSSIIYGTFKSTESADLTQSIVDCNLVNHPKIVSQILKSTTVDVKNIIETIKNVDTFDSLARSCVSVGLTTTTSTTTTQSPLSLLMKPRAFSVFGIPSEIFIAPGTKWCGPGNRASSYDDLGSAVETDKCCRDHDHCPMSINAGESDYNLTNYTPYTISHCDCDQQLATCLKEASKSDIGASLFGVIYFNIIKFRCFRETFPPTQCLEYSGLSNSSDCLKYAESAEPVYALQDGPIYT